MEALPYLGCIYVISLIVSSLLSAIDDGIDVCQVYVPSPLDAVSLVCDT
jgi:hypothetical protein